MNHYSKLFLSDNEDNNRTIKEQKVPLRMKLICMTERVY